MNVSAPLRASFAASSFAVFRRASGAPFICSVSIAALLAGVSSGSAQTITKADNSDNLNLGSSWSGGVVPGATNIALWDATVTGASSTLLGANLSWSGLRITSPAGPVTIGAGNTLTLGTAGIDMGSSTVDATLNNGVTLAAGTTQLWQVASGRTLTINGALTRSAGSTLKFQNSGTINISSGTAGSFLLAGNSPYAVYNGTDFAALDANKNVAAGASVLAYTVPAGTGNVTLSGTITGVVDVVNGTGIRLGNSLTITNGLRFATPAPAGGWFVDTASAGRLLTTGAILVTPDVGAANVTIQGGGSGIRMNGSSGNDLILHQFNTAGDLILLNPINNNNSSTGVIKDGPGKVVLGATMFNTGVYRVLEGTLQIGNNSATGALSTSSTVISDGTVAFNRTDTFAFPNAISGGGQVTQAGSGTLSLTGANTYTGATNFNGGTVEFSSLGNFGNGTTLNFGGGTLRYAAGTTTDISTRVVNLTVAGGTIDTNGNNVTFASTIGNGGAGGLTKIGAGTLTLSTGNNYAGPTAVNGGALQVVNATGSATGTGSVAVNLGGTLQGNGKISGAVTVTSGGILSPGNGVGTITVGSLSLSTGSILNMEFSSTPANDLVSITNPGGLSISGGGFNLFAEGTTNAWSTPGTYNLFSFTGALGGTGLSALSVRNPAPGFSYAFGSTTNSLTLTIATAGLITDWKTDANSSWGNTANWTNGIPNEVSATARFGNAISAPRTVTLDGAKTVGAISFDNANGYTIAAGSGGSLTLNMSSGPATLSVTTGSHAVSAPVTLASNLTASIAAGGTLALSGDVSGAKLLTKTSAGLLVLSGNNSYSGGTQLNGGTVEFANAASLGTGDISFDSGALRWAASNVADISARAVTFGAGGATLDTNGNTVTLASAVGNGGAGGLTKAGTGTLVLQGSNSYRGTTTITGGTLSINDNANLGDATIGSGLVLNGGGLSTASTIALDAFGSGQRPVTIGALGGGIDVADFATLTVSGNVSGTGLLTKTGPGTLLLTGNNATTFSGGATILGGVVELGGGQPNGQQGIGSGPVTLSGGTLTMNGHLVDNVSGWGTLGNAINVPAGQTGTLNMTSRGIFSGALTGGGTFNLNVNFTRGDVVPNWSAFTGLINVNSSNGGPDDFRIAGFGILNIPSARLALGDGVYMYQSFNPPSGTGTQTVHTIGELSGSASAVIAGNPVAGRFVNWTVGTLNTDSTFAGAIQDSAGASRLTKVGTGTLTLSGFSTYTGDTTVNGGALLVSGSIGGTTGVTVNTSGKLQLGANDVINNLATLTLNNGSLETLGFSDTLGSLALSIAAVIDLGQGASVLHFASSDLTPWSGTLSISNWSGSASGGGTDQILFGSAANGITADQLAMIQFVNPAGFAPGIYQAGILSTGEIIAVPEPSAMVSVVAGLGLLCWRGRFRRRSQNAE